MGGNALWGEQPVIIAHQLVRLKLRSGSYVSPEGWIDTLARALSAGDDEGRPTVFEPLYHAFMEGGRGPPWPATASSGRSTPTSTGSATSTCW